MNGRPHPEDWKYEAESLMRLPRNDMQLAIMRALAYAWRDGRQYEQQEEKARANHGK